MYIARSTTICCDASITAETSVITSSGASLSTRIVVRDNGGSVYCLTIGVWPNGSR